MRPSPPVLSALTCVADSASSGVLDHEFAKPVHARATARTRVVNKLVAPTAIGLLMRRTAHPIDLNVVHQPAGGLPTLTAVMRVVEEPVIVGTENHM